MIKAQLLEFSKRLTREAEAAARPDSMIAYSQVMLNLAGSYDLVRNVELHQEFHDGQAPEGFELPGEAPLVGPKN